jgi:hypothetical protein
MAWLQDGCCIVVGQPAAGVIRDFKVISKKINLCDTVAEIINWHWIMTMSKILGQKNRKKPEKIRPKRYRKRFKTIGLAQGKPKYVI